MCSELNFILFTETVKTLRNIALQGLAETKKDPLQSFHVKRLYDYLTSVQHAYAEEAKLATHITMADNHSPPHLYPLLQVQ
jgi:protein tyrosine/serine phosphatase